jgi:sec-independent protein translocase protein TatC
MATKGAEDENRMPLLDHLVELRRRLIWCVAAFVVCFIGAYAFAEDIFLFLAEPLRRALEGQPNAKMVFTAMTEAFFTYMKIAFYTAAFISFPVVSVQIWKFVAPGLYKNEKKAFAPFLVATPVLFLMGAALAYYIIFPLAWHFLLNFQVAGGPDNMPIEVLPKVDAYLSISLRLIFAFGIAFELPVLLSLLARAGIIDAADLAGKRRYAIVGAFVVAAVLTPPDVVSQIALAIPLIVLYEISIFCARLIEKQREREEKEREEEAAKDVTASESA